jgi:desulfoferrodoxin (superoxide reductase-like protein)
MEGGDANLHLLRERKTVMRGVFQSLLALAAVVRGELTCDSMFAEMGHRQMTEHNKALPFVSTGPTDILGGLHTPVMTFQKDLVTGMTYGKVLVGVGNTEAGPAGCPNDCVHPLTASNDPDAVHYITTIMIMDETGAVLSMGELTAEDNNGQVASLDFNFPTPQKMTPYVYCSIHGLWQGETVTLSTTNSSKATCDVPKCLKEQDAVAVGSAVAVLKHRQNVTQGTKDAFPVKAYDILNSLHRPSLETIGGMVKVTIGMGPLDGPAGCPNQCYHPVTASSDSTVVHWPEYVYVENENGLVVYFQELAPSGDGGPVKVYFETPASSTVLTAYTYCNIHGLFMSAPFQVSGGSALPSARCGFYQ